MVNNRPSSSQIDHGKSKADGNISPGKVTCLTKGVRKIKLICLNLFFIVFIKFDTK